MRVTLLLAFSVTLALALPIGQLSQFPVDSGAFMLDTTPAGYTLSASVQQFALASNGYQSLLAWCDSAHTNIWARRIGQDGLPADTARFSVVGGSVWDVRAVAGLDTGWVVIWNAGSNLIKGVRIGAHGQVVSPVPNIASNAQEPAAAQGDSSVLVVWRENSVYSYLSSVMFRRDGTVTAPSRIAGGSSRMHPRRRFAAAGGTGSFLVVFEVAAVADTGIYGVLLDTAGHTPDTIPFPVSGEAEGGATPSVAFDGANYLVVWRCGNTSEANIVGKRLTPDGTFLDRQAFTISSAAGLQMSPKVQRLGNGWRVVWTDSRNGNADVYGSRVLDDGTVLDPGGVPVCATPAAQQSPLIAGGDTSCLVAWLDDRVQPLRYNLHCRNIGESGTPTTPDTALTGTRTPWYATQQTPVVASDGENFLAVWATDTRGTGKWDINGIRVSQSAQVLDTAPIVIATGPGLHATPSVAFCESLYLVVWKDSGSGYTIVKGARINPSGRLLDSTPLYIGADAYGNCRDPLVASIDSHWYVKWQGQSTGRVTLVSLDGRPASTVGNPVPGATAIAAGDTNCALVWANSSGVWVMRTTPEGVTIDPSAVQLSTNTDAANPSVAWDGLNYAVAWQRNGSNIIAFRLLPAVGPPAGSQTLTCGRAAYTPCIASTREAWVTFFNAQTWTSLHSYYAMLNRDLGDCMVYDFDSLGKPGVPKVTFGTGPNAFVVFSCTTNAVGNHQVRVERAFAEIGLLPPASLWPPDGYHFLGPPVQLQVDGGTFPPDSFEFLVRARSTGDTVWLMRLAVPCCTIPDTALSTYYWFTWQACAHRPGEQWGQYGAERGFYVDYLTGLAGPSNAHLPLMLLVESPASGRLVTATVSGAAAGAELSLHDMLGRVLWSSRLTGDGTYSCGPPTGRGGRLSAGVYCLRLRCGDLTLTRRVVLP
jgi:hypothetical protein